MAQSLEQLGTADKGGALRRLFVLDLSDILEY
jgi:hypothetical protein